MSIRASMDYMKVYYYISDHLTVQSTLDKHYGDDYCRYHVGNYFNNYEDANETCVKMRGLLL